MGDDKGGMSVLSRGVRRSLSSPIVASPFVAHYRLPTNGRSTRADDNGDPLPASRERFGPMVLWSPSSRVPILDLGASFFL